MIDPKQIDWVELVSDLMDQPIEEVDGMKEQHLYLGSVLDITPSGKYYMPWACSNVTEEEAYNDEAWWEEMDALAEKHGCFLTSGEGDACDVFLCRVIED